MASQSTRVGRAQAAVFTFRKALMAAEAEFAAIVDEGGLAWLNAADPPLEAGVAQEAIDARSAIVAIRTTLEANAEEHEKALVRFEA